MKEYHYAYTVVYYVVYFTAFCLVSKTILYISICRTQMVWKQFGHFNKNLLLNPFHLTGWYWWQTIGHH